MDVIGAARDTAMVENASLRIRALLVVGAVSLAVGIAESFMASGGHASLGWTLTVDAPAYLAGLIAVTQRPGDRSAQRLAVLGVALPATNTVDLLWYLLVDNGSLPGWLITMAGQAVVLVSIVVITQLLATYPDAVAETPAERRLVTWTPRLLALPLVLAVASPTLIDPTMGFSGIPAGRQQPLALPGLQELGPIMPSIYEGSQAVVIVGIVLLVLRYRRSTAARRQRIRWLLLPILTTAMLITLTLVAELTPPALSPRPFVDWAWLVVLPMTMAALAMGILRGGSTAVDVVLRKWLVYGFLWAVIGGAYVLVAAGAGMAAASRLPTGSAIALAIIATLAFQPARRRLEGLADRFVFGDRMSRYEALADFGRTVHGSFELDEMLDRLAEAARAGLGAPWTRVEVDGDDQAVIHATAGRAAGGEQEGLTVPIQHEGEIIGRIVAGRPTRDNDDDSDKDLLQQLAGHAALGVSVLQLTTALEAHVDQLARRTQELEVSRIRLVRAQEEERRRLERDLHDGIQQDVIALMANVGIARRNLAGSNAASAEEVLGDVYAALGGLLDEIRQLARGIHPAVLSDRGLVEAVEDRAARIPVPVNVTADAALRSQRFAPDIEGAAYFTISEGLTNALKHAEADRIDVEMSRQNGTLTIAVRDNGRGIAPDATEGGSGLRNISERLEALGGRMSVTSGDSGTELTAILRVRDEGAPDG